MESGFFSSTPQIEGYTAQEQADFEARYVAAYDTYYHEGELIGKWLRAEIIIEELSVHADSMENKAQIDDLTGLLRRDAFTAEIQKKYESSQRSRDLTRTHSVLVLDLDNFKHVNDAYGHLVGDVLLRETGKVIKQNLSRKNDRASRWGGEEFVVFLADAEPEDAKTVAEHMQEELNKLKIESGSDKDPIGIGVTIGIAKFKHGTDFEERFKAADNAMYKGKKLNSDKNQIVIAED